MLLAPALVVLWVVSAAAPAEKQDVDDLAGLLDSTVVSGASKSLERSPDAPATVTVITREDLRRVGVRSLDEAINFLSVGMLTQDPLHSVEIGARGVLLTGDYGNHVLLLIDGHVINEPWDGTAYFEQGAAIPFELIDHIEVLVGPGSVLYGTNAMLGVIHVVTRRAKDLGTVELTAEGTGLAPLDVDGTPSFEAGSPGWAGRVSALAGHEATLGGRVVELVLGVEYYRHRGPSLTFARQAGLTQTVGGATAPADYGPREAPGLWGGRTTGAWWTEVPVVVLKARAGDFSAWARLASAARSTPYLGFNGGGDFDVEFAERDRWANTELLWRRELGERLDLELKVSFDAYDYADNIVGSMWEVTGSGEPLPAGANPRAFRFREQDTGTSTRFAAGLLARVDWLGTGRFPFLAGLELISQGIGADNLYAALDGTPLGHVGAYQVDERRLAVVLQQRALFTPVLSLNAGVRLDAQDGDPPHVSPRVALAWRAPWDATLKALLSTAFRAPTGYERYATYAGIQIAHPGLESEHIQTVEVSYSQRVGRHRWLLNAFTSQLSALVSSVPAPAELAPNGEFWYANAGTIETSGVSAQLSGALGDFSWGGAFTWAAVKTEAGGLAVSPTWFGNARVGWEGRGLRPSVSLAAFFTGAQWSETAFATATAADGTEPSWRDASRVPEQCQLRLSVGGPLPARGLAWRATAGGALNAFGPYTAGPTRAPDPERSGAAPQLAPANHRLFLSTTLTWTLDPP